MIRYLIPVPFLFSFGCTSAGEHTDELSEAQWIKPNIEGHWELVSSETVKNTHFLSFYSGLHEPEGEETKPEPPYDAPDLVFEGDSLYHVWYPISLDDRFQYTVEDGKLNISSGHYHKSFPIESVNDTLFIYRPHHDYDTSYVKEGYLKTSLNDSILDMLKVHEANFPEFAGTWHLVRESTSDWGEHYVLDFPHELPDSITITRQEFIDALGNDRIYLLSTDGEPREYRFIHWFGDLVLIPGDWYEGDDPWIYFEGVKTKY